MEHRKIFESIDDAIAEVASWNRAQTEALAPGSYGRVVLAIATGLSPDDDAEAIAAWLQARDPDGSHTAERALADNGEPYTLTEAWVAVATLVATSMA